MRETFLFVDRPKSGIGEDTGFQAQEVRKQECRHPINLLPFLTTKNKRGQACKPNFVSPSADGDDDHSSSPAIARGIQRPTRESVVLAGRAAPPPLFGLAPCGVYPAATIARRAVRSYPPVDGSRSAGPHLFTLIHPAERDRRYLFCGTFRAGDVRSPFRDIPLRPSPLASTLPCGVRTFLSPLYA